MPESKPSTKRKQPASRIPKWRTLPDSILLAAAPVYRGLPKPQSLSPDHRVIEANAAGDMAAMLIVAAYRFSCPVIEVRA
ncbi:hypothetical protein HNQ77_002689 [Silvibacterium bohemicum]|uniref:Uncharacterized protein n=1 Tax=Silvibacterium bohemicum TaxID=1577686 RepID=A0A841JTK2_9BACT|nr:hypothetical protein [Silvibacterium bohemicum]MBB6144733.1 hypothetical protein [Silvibacterium bohemicum]